MLRIDYWKKYTVNTVNTFDKWLGPYSSTIGPYDYLTPISGWSNYSTGDIYSSSPYFTPSGYQADLLRDGTVCMVSSDRVDIYTLF